MSIYAFRWSIVLSCMLFLTACAQETVAHQQDERQANRILVLLRQSGIGAQKVKDAASRELRFNVVVGSTDTAGALSVLERYNLPEKERTGTAESFGKGGMIPTAEQERAKRVVGIEGDLVNSLRKIPRVISAEAAVSIPEVDPLRGENEARPRPKASVIVVYLKDSSGTPPVSVEEVQRHVQAKLPEMRTREVNVLLLPSSGDVGGDSSTAEAGLAIPIDPAVGCAERERVLGIDICKGEGTKILNWLIVVMSVSGIMAGLAVISVLRALRYRRDLTRLTAEYRQVRG